jgi:hypothetical protein
MDRFKQTIGGIRKKSQESNINSKRMAENFPFVERKNDDIVFDSSFQMEYFLSDHPHSVHLNLYIKPPQSCFQCNPAPGVTSLPSVQCVATCPSFGPADGLAYPGIYDTFTVNTGGFQISPTGGIIIPQDGYYNIRFLNDIGGVTVSHVAGVIASTRHNGIIKSQVTYTVGNGRISPPLSGLGVSVDIFGLCIAARAGDVIGGWLAAGGVAFYTPSNFCGLFGTSKTYIQLVGLA